MPCPISTCGQMKVTPSVAMRRNALGAKGPPPLAASARARRGAPISIEQPAADRSADLQELAARDGHRTTPAARRTAARMRG